MKKSAIPIGIAIAIVSAVVSYVGYGKYKSAIEVINATEVQAVAGLRSQAGKESESIRSEAASQRSSLQATAGSETTTLRQEAGKMRQQNSEASQKLQQQIATLRQKNDGYEVKITQLVQQGDSLKEKYDKVGTQLAVLQGPNSYSVHLSDSLTISDQVSALPPNLAKSELRYYSIGSSGPEVEKIQKRLAELGCYDGTVSGQFDAQTKASVEKFNTARGELFPSGVIDPVGWDNLFSPFVSARRLATHTAATLSLSGATVVLPDVLTSVTTRNPVLGAARCTGEAQ